MNIFAHSANDTGQRHDLFEHLCAVSLLAASFAKPLRGEDLARYAGLLHDLGKIHPEWQAYLLRAEAGQQRKGTGPGHKGAGALLAQRHNLDMLALLIAGHHGGLPSLAKLKSWVRTYQAEKRVDESIRLATEARPELLAALPPLPTHLKSVWEGELFTRLLYSALVDADFLDTEHHFAPTRAERRQVQTNWATLWQTFSHKHQAMEVKATSLNDIRREIYNSCCAKASLPPGFFRLTVPTGGGKTLSSLAFALLHALAHKHQRIIYAIPYLSITEQVASVFRGIFPDSGIVLEHHSSAFGAETTEDGSGASWQRLAAENWDAPLIVTTTVQFFESLLGHTPGACRKLHNIAGSIILLDEAQMLPSHFLTTILDVLRQLVECYGCTIVLCTATQPALDDRQGFAGLQNVVEIIDEPDRLFARMIRVSYQWPTKNERWSWEQVAERMREHSQVLTIVNTKRDALTVFQWLADPDALHLSTLMCGAHRRAVLREVRVRLLAGAPCHLVSTQLIEAGVDVDFALVLRAMAPLDSVIQAGGRANREGRLPEGRVIVFEPLVQQLPRGAYQIGTDTLKEFLARDPVDCNDLATIRSYFELYYRRVNRDLENIQPLRAAFDYPAVASLFRMVKDEAIPVLVRYERDMVDQLLHTISQRGHMQRSDWRLLQPHLVNLSENAHTRCQKQGCIAEVVPGLWLWKEEYHPQYGLAQYPVLTNVTQVN